MSKQNRYPKLNIWSVEELARRIAFGSFTKDEAAQLISDVQRNFEKYWRDTEHSQPGKQKYVRSAAGTPLGVLLGHIDKRILKPQDHLVPDFLFGGLSGRNHIQAAQTLLGADRDRILLGLDITRFFEQIVEARVFYFFNQKCGCSAEVARLLARLCCVPKGPKNNPETTKTLARGFATSTRLALWCNLDTFVRVSWLVKKKLKRHDPKLTIFVDDIGVTASKVSVEEMEKISKQIQDLLVSNDPNQPLPINPKKEKIVSFSTGRAEHLGLKLGRSKLAIGSKSQSKRDKVDDALKTATSKDDRKKLLARRKGIYRYARQVRGNR